LLKNDLVFVWRSLAPGAHRAHLKKASPHFLAVSFERLFIAVALPEPVREQLVALYEPVRGIAWTRPEQLHLTLRFLGDVEVSLRESLETALARIQVEPFVLPISEVGSFPPHGPVRVLWIGVGHGHPRLFQLRQQVDDAVLTTGLSPDLRFFHPHVTLGRVKDEAPPGAAAQFLRKNREFAAAPIRVDAVHLYGSQLHPGGAVHTLWRTFPLRQL
jgi:RNA 2',3'-cyclic 3'-phosphodiesterase